jgi:Ig domain of plant-specific actin-binding protein
VKPARTLLPRLLGAAGLTAALVVALTAFSGIGSAAPTAAQAEYAPTNTTPPSITGTPQVGQVLTAQPGAWNSTTAPTFAYQWQRCNTTGAACSNISGATNQTYTVQSADQGATLRVQVTATNPGGSTQATSAQTALIQAAAAPTPTGPAGAIKLPNGQTSIPASSVTLPNRLIIDGVRFSPNPIRSRGPVVARFHVSDTSGNVVRDALVYALGLPYGWTRNSAEVRTNQAGFATLSLIPTRNLPVGRRGALVVFVRARVEGQNLLAGSSTRRLVQASIR